MYNYKSVNHKFPSVADIPSSNMQRMLLKPITDFLLLPLKGRATFFTNLQLK